MKTVSSLLCLMLESQLNDVLVTTSEEAEKGDAGKNFRRGISEKNGALKTNPKRINWVKNLHYKSKWCQPKKPRASKAERKKLTKKNGQKNECYARTKQDWGQKVFPREINWGPLVIFLKRSLRVPRWSCFGEWFLHGYHILKVTQVYIFTAISSHVFPIVLLFRKLVFHSGFWLPPPSPWEGQERSWTLTLPLRIGDVFLENNCQDHHKSHWAASYLNSHYCDLKLASKCYCN